MSKTSKNSVFPRGGGILPTLGFFIFQGCFLGENEG